MVEPIPPVSVLRAFEAAVKHKSFSKAGDSLGVSQSAISHSIRDLEIIIGKKLFNRTSRHTYPTPDALMLCDAIRGGFETIHNAVAYCRSTSDENELIVSSFPGFAVKWLFPRLIRFDAACPDIAVSLRTLGAVREVGEGEADIALHYGLKAAYRSFDVEPLLEEDLIPVCSPEYLADSSRLNSAEDLANHTLLNDEMVSAEGVQSLWNYWLEQIDVPRLVTRKRRSFGQSNMVIQAALENRGVALGRTPLIIDDLRDRKLVIPFGPRIPSPFRYSIVTFNLKRKKEQVTAFKSWIMEEAEKTSKEFEQLLDSISNDDSAGMSRKPSEFSSTEDERLSTKGMD